MNRENRPSLRRCSASAGWTALDAVALAILGTLGTIGGIALVRDAGTTGASLA